ncbi:MAG: GTP cyclohydrolase II [Polyangiaceae bacterium]|nr:GTP cyclohydrolase II [Polyangiaceae bacterium]
MHVPEGVIRPQLEVIARAPVPTHFGTFEMYVFRWGQAAADPRKGLSPDHVALVMGELRGERDVLARVHSECLTSEVFGSLKCDCRDQLEAAQRAIADQGQGVVLYLRQEGRGIGLANKIRAYELQSAGADTVDANRLLGLPDDARDYGAAAAMLAHLGVASVRLLTNNPDKVGALRRLGVEVSAREPSITQPSELAALYLETKRRRMGHQLPELALEHAAAGGFCVPGGDAE